MDERTAAIRQRIAQLKEEYGLRFDELLSAYENTPTIPAQSFATNLTPLETAATYLAQNNYEPKTIAKLLNRTTSIVNNALKNSKKKQVAVKEQDTIYRIPVTAFNDTRISPAEAVIVHLRERYELDNKAIARLLGRDQRNTWHLYKQACKKRGEHT